MRPIGLIVFLWNSINMKLNEIMSLGGDNSLGKLVADAKINIKKHAKNATLKKTCDSILDALNVIEQSPNVLQTDGYSLMQYLQQLTNPTIDIQTMSAISDALASYDDSEGD